MPSGATSIQPAPDLRQDLPATAVALVPDLVQSLDPINQLIFALPCVWSSPSTHPPVSSGPNNGVVMFSPHPGTSPVWTVYRISMCLFVCIGGLVIVQMNILLSYIQLLVCHTMFITLGTGHNPRYLAL